MYKKVFINNRSSKKKGINNYISVTKEEEWFKQKYHPEDSAKRKSELKDMLMKRVKVFQVIIVNYYLLYNTT